jgi:hypothetical protein
MQQWPLDLPDPVRRRILALWSAASGAASVNERVKALDALAQLQRDHELSDVALNFIAETELQQPSELDDVSESIPPNLIVLIVELIRWVGIITTIENALTSAFWTLHTYVYEMFTYTARLALWSRETGCGKSVLLALMEPLVDQGLKADDTTPPAIYRRLKRQRTTYLLDEVEHSEILSGRRFKAQYNMGYQGGFIEVAGEEFPIGKFALAVALVVSKNAYLSPQAARRSIMLEMTKHCGGRNKIKTEKSQTAIAVVRGLIPAWVDTFKPPEEIQMPVGLTTDARNNWEPLVAVADSLGYGATARALALAMDRQVRDPVTELMLDSFRVFQQLGDHIWTPEYLEALHQLEDAKWDEYRGPSGMGKPHKITRAELYDLLEVKGIWSKTIWKGKRGEGGRSAKGFERGQFEPTWAALGVTPAQSNKIISLPRYKQRHAGGTGDTGDTGDDVKEG